MFLNCHTYYSLRYGTIKPEDLLLLAKKHEIDTLALTDINTTSACLDVVRLAPKYNTRIVLGVDFRNRANQQFVMLAKNNNGFLQINRYLSSFLHNKKAIPDRAAQLPDTFVIYPFGKVSEKDLIRLILMKFPFRLQSIELLRWCLVNLL